MIPVDLKAYLMPVDLQAYRRAHRDRLRVKMPSLATMVRMLKVPRVWQRLEAHHRLIVQKAERLAIADADAVAVVTYMRPLGAMVHAHYHADELRCTVIPLAEAAQPVVGHADG